MRKVLLGTTALVAASFVASAAMADEMMAEPISLSVGGHHFAALALLSGDDGKGEALADVHSTSMLQDMQVVLSGSTTLDNGMTVGVTAKLDSSSGEDQGDIQLDERFITLGGAFGSLRLGSVESARQQTTTFAPNAAGMMGINTPYFTFAGAIARYDDGIGAEDALKLIYFTPAMNGFSLGVSYAPQDSGGAQYGGDTSDDAGAYKNHVGVGATFSQDFAGGSVSASAGYETYDAEVPNGSSCGDLRTGKYRLDDKLALLAAGVAAGKGTAVELANEAWIGEGANPLLDQTALATLTVENARDGHHLRHARRSDQRQLRARVGGLRPVYELRRLLRRRRLAGGPTAPTRKREASWTSASAGRCGPLSLAAMYGQVEQRGRRRRC